MAELKFTDTRSRLVGYVRVSSVEQETALQLAAMAQAGITVVFEEKRSSVVDRPVLREALASLQRGDTLCVYKIDRLARSLMDLMVLLNELAAKGCTFRSLTEPIETTTPAGRLMVQILGSFAEFERAVIRERCAAGRLAAKARGVKMGGPRSFDYERAAELRLQGWSYVRIAAELGAHKGSIRHALTRTGMVPFQKRSAS